MNILDKEFEFAKNIDEQPIWSPEDFDFQAKKIGDHLTREDVYYKGSFELRRMPYNYWLLRKKVKNDRQNTEYLVRFYLKVDPTEIDFAKDLFTKGLR